MILKKKIFC